MRPKLRFLPVFGAIMGLLTLLCLWNAISDFRIASSMRKAKAKVVAQKLTIDFGRPDSESNEEPLYTVALDLLATDGTQRTFHWEGDPPGAIYPEEALDYLQKWAVGTEHTVAMLRGNAREVRFDDFESNPEIGKGIAWIFVAFFLGITGFAAFAVASQERELPFLRGLGAWTVFFGFGLLPLLGAFPVAWGTSQKVLTWKPVTATKVGERAPFDVNQSIPNVELTAKAKEKLAEHPYQRIAFPFNGRTVHGGLGPWQGIYDRGIQSDTLQFFVNPKDRFEIAPKLSWGEDFGAPTGILLFFGLAFTGAGLLIRRFDRSF